MTKAAEPLAANAPEAAHRRARDDRGAQDRAYCRAMLPRVSRTFAINIRLLNGTLGDAVRVGYLLCRAADALEDSWPGGAEALACRFHRLVQGLEGDRAAAETLAIEAGTLPRARDDIDLVAHLPRVLRVYDELPAPHRESVSWGVRTLAEGMARFAARAAGRAPGAPYVENEAELDDYCWVVAGCVGVMLTRLYAAEYGEGARGLQERRLELAPTVGQALQLTNILLDWPADVRRGRCYVPAQWLEETGLEAQDLVGRDHPGVRAVVTRLEARARRALALVPDYVDLVPARHVRYRLFCLWPALWALRSLRHAARDPEFPWGPRRPRLPRAQIVTSAIGSSLPGLHGRALRELRRSTLTPTAR